MTSSMRSLRFGVLSSQEVLCTSVLEIKTVADLMSPRLGAARETLCETCGQAHGVCQGHFGHITLPFPMLHPLHTRVAETIHRYTCARCNCRVVGNKCTTCKIAPQRHCTVEDALQSAREDQWSDHCRHCSPADLVICHLPVPPALIRPNNDTYHSALTSLLSGVVKACMRYKRVVSQGGTSCAVLSSRSMLVRRVKDYFLSPADSRSPGLCSRLKGKEGRMRKNLMGFRVNRAGRCVITPDPLCPPGELRVPPSVCDQLGIKDGEVVLFNRQPSLHRGSLMAHVARRGRHRTFSFSPTVCAPYNADFDGDEMNLHKLSTVDSQVEARLLMGVDSNMVSPATGKQWVNLVQDCVLSKYLQGRGDEPAPRTLEEVHSQQIQCLEWIESNGFSVGLDDFDHRVRKRGHSDHGAVARTADVILGCLPQNNSLVQMVRARSKGSAVNLVQLLSCVGWQTVQGKPSVGPESHRSSSFVESSYAEGLDPDEFWHHASAGREGLIHTAIKTSKTGYCQRKLVKFLEDVVTEYDGTVRSRHDNAVVQFQTDEEPGTPVGIISAQSIGQPVTQSTLNQFHHAGIENDTNLASLLKLLAPSQNATTYTWKGVRGAYMLAPVRWKGTSEAGTPTEHELEEARVRGVRVPAKRFVGPAPEGSLGWQFAARLRAACGYAHYAWRSHEIITCCPGVQESSDWCTQAKNEVLTENGRMPVHETAGHRGYCTNAHRMARTYGIEAARAALLRELISFGSILPKHYELLADTMTFTGTVRSVNRSGMKDMGNILGHACFETVITTMMEAGRLGRADNMRATSSRLAVGMAPKMGTKAFEVIEHVERRLKRPSETASFLSQPVVKKKKFILTC